MTESARHTHERSRSKKHFALISIVVLLIGISTLIDAAPAGAASIVTVHLDAPMVGMAATSDSRGYWTVGSDGGVFAFGDAHFMGSMGGKHLNAPIVAISTGPAGHGYWLLASDGGVFAFGDAPYYGSMGGKHLHSPVVGIAATPDAKGYWMVASDGGVFAFGDAHFYGSMGDKHLNAPAMGLTATPDGKGYVMVASDGGVFAFGDAHFYGSMGDKHLNAPIVSIAVDATTDGYRMVGSDGGVFAFHSKFDGSKGGSFLNAPIRTVTPTRTGSGYWLSGEAGGVFAFGGAPFEGAINGILPSEGFPVDAFGPRIVAVAQSQVGQTDPYLYGPSASDWCAFFLSWVWKRAGIPIPATAMAYEVGAWALANGGTLLPPTATPRVGDAVLFESPYSGFAWPDGGGLSYPNIEHVNIVAQVLPGDQIITIGGDESGAVREQGPYSAAGASSWWGQAVYGFVQPPGV
jgi:hypothetical protein